MSFILFDIACVRVVHCLMLFFFSSSGILQQWSRSEPLLAFPRISCQQRSIQLHAAVTKLGFLFTYLPFKYWIHWNLLSRCFSSSFTNYPTTIGEQERMENHITCVSLLWSGRDFCWLGNNSCPRLSNWEVFIIIWYITIIPWARVRYEKSDKITNECVAQVGYNHFISNKGEWNNCFSKFSAPTLAFLAFW